MSTKSDTARLIVRVNDAAEEIKSLNHGIDSLKSGQQTLDKETTDSENKLRTTISQVVAILKTIAIEDEKVSRVF